MPSGHPSFDHTVQEGNIWLKAVAERLHLEERGHAYSALTAVLHALRDRLTPENAVHRGAQMPIVIRGALLLTAGGLQISRSMTTPLTSSVSM